MDQFFSPVPKRVKSLLAALRLGAAIFALSSLAACAAASGESKMYYHSFSFNAITDAKKYGHPEVEVLDYAYGDSHRPRTSPSKVDREMNPFFYEQNTTGEMPRPEFLYVKWRVRATGQVFEDRVDLSHRLPADITNYEIHFVVDDAKLFVFALPPYETKDALGRLIVHGGAWVRDMYYADRYVEYKKQHQIYPDIAK